MIAFIFLNFIFLVSSPDEAMRVASDASAESLSAILVDQFGFPIIMIPNIMILPLLTELVGLLLSTVKQTKYFTEPQI